MVKRLKKEEIVTKKERFAKKERPTKEERFIKEKWDILFANIKENIINVDLKLKKVKKPVKEEIDKG